MTRRPFGVTLSAILLILAAVLLVLFAAISTLTIVLGLHTPATPGAPQPPAALLTAVGLGIVLFYLALAGWTLTTAIGLIRLKPWSRISVIVIGAALAAISTLFALIFFAMPTLMATVSMPPTASPAMLHSVFIVFGVLSLLIATIGIVWVIYFAQRSTRDAFQPQAMHQVVNPYSPPPLPHAHSLEFHEAQPIPTYAPPATTVYADAPPPIPYTHQRPVSRRPASIVVIAVLLFLSALSTIPAIFMQHTQFMGVGLFLHGPAARAGFFLYFIWGAATASGLVLLNKLAWRSALVYGVYNILNAIMLITPFGRAHMERYFLERMANSPLGTPQLAFNPFAPPLFNLIMLPGMVLSVALTITILVFLWRASWAFNTPPDTETSHERTPSS